MLKRSQRGASGTSVHPRAPTGAIGIRIKIGMGLGVAVLTAALMLWVLGALHRSRAAPGSARAPVPMSGPPRATTATPFREPQAYPEVVANSETSRPPRTAVGGTTAARSAAVRAAPAAPVSHPTLPAASLTTATDWIDRYRDSVCACASRTCVRDLQARFIEALSRTNYDEERDGPAFTEASRAAIRCYTALPEHS